MRLLRIPAAFDHSTGFRALGAYHRPCLPARLAQRAHLQSWPQLAEEIAHVLRCRSAVLDGELCCLQPDGRSHFKRLLFRREWPYFMAFDLLMLDGRDLRDLPLLERKRRLLSIMPAVGCRVVHLDHLAGRGCDLFRAACERDLEGIVGKWAHGRYQGDGRGTSWLKIKNPEYSQIVGRRELCEERRHSPSGNHRPPTPELRFL